MLGIVLSATLNALSLTVGYLLYYIGYKLYDGNLAMLAQLGQVDQS